MIIHTDFGAYELDVDELATKAEEAYNDGFPDDSITLTLTRTWPVSKEPNPDEIILPLPGTLR